MQAQAWCSPRRSTPSLRRRSGAQRCPLERGSGQAPQASTAGVDPETTTATSALNPASLERAGHGAGHDSAVGVIRRRVSRSAPGALARTPTPSR
ncbi:hypothetical protein J2T57_001645 [Natronocella acetinitrilica]|uniref:Uncharacterized protein n=1 Tax=Natronocella acetinitrilica TaxID=414046 RepID=A0AAE3G3K3_9GAMM|nr:hypothetical protein [Natronocella acetinitrilica]